MFNFLDFRHNVLIQYTILSILITLSIVFIVISSFSKSTQEHSIEIHSKVYTDFILSIPKNYPGIFDPLKNNDHSSDGHDHEEINNDLEHFVKDILIFPDLSEINIYSTDQLLIYQYKKNNNNLINKHDENLLEKALKGEILKFVHELNNVIILHTFLPVFSNNKVVGVVEIIDSDEEFSMHLKQSNRTIFVQVFIIGFIFYIIIFILFLRVYLSQNRVVERLHKSQELTIYSMSVLAELRDNDTGSHILRTQEYCKVLALELRKNKQFKNYLSSEYIEDLVRSAPLHDIGKVGIPDNILLKKGKLTEAEFELIKKHPKYGADVLSRVANKLDYETYFTIGIQVILHHHENWDGSGYPDGLKGEAIPLSARIMAIADVYDALRTNRPYKDPISHKEAMQIMISNSGKKFDPELIKHLLNIDSIFEDISNKQE